jgi:glycosyltransferase involved in cell wall biosynthesis
LDASPVTIVVWLILPWDHFHRQAFLRALSEQRVMPCRLLCVEPPQGRVSGAAGSTSAGGTGLQTLSPSLAVLAPQTAVSHGLARLLGVERRLFRSIARSVDQALADLKWDERPRIAWIYSPTQWAAPALVREDLAVYECYDQHAAMLAPGRKRDRLVRDEQRLLAAVDAVVVTSQALAEEKGKHHRCVYHMPNASEVEFFAAVRGGTVQVPPEIAAWADRPVVGYLGTIHEGTDLELLTQIAQSHPEWKLLVVGPVQQGMSARRDQLAAFRSQPNVRLTGWVDKEDLLGYCKAFDVGIIPYRLESEFNAFVTPNKLFEYLAMGLPVVSVDMPGLGAYREFASVAGTHDVFVEQIAATLRGVHPPTPPLEVVSWEDRADKVAGFVHSQLEKPEGCAR